MRNSLRVGNVNCWMGAFYVDADSARPVELENSLGGMRHALGREDVHVTLYSLGGRPVAVVCGRGAEGTPSLLAADGSPLVRGPVLLMGARDVGEGFELRSLTPAEDGLVRDCLRLTWMKVGGKECNAYCVRGAEPWGQ